MLSAGRNLSIFLLSVCFFALSLSLFSQVLSWILLLVCCAFVMRVALFLEWHKNLPKVSTLNLLALLSGLALFSIQLGLLLSMVNLLVMASALKLMLLRKQRDFSAVACYSVFSCCLWLYLRAVNWLQLVLCCD